MTRSRLGEFYKSFMASEQGGGLDPHDMRRSWKDMSLSGGYRKVVVKPGEGMTAEVRAYQREDEDLWGFDEPASPAKPALPASSVGGVSGIMQCAEAERRLIM